MATKPRKITFHTIVKQMWKNNAEGVEGSIPFYQIDELIDYIIRLRPKTNKFFELQGMKTCLIQSATTHNAGNIKIITGFFKSARHTFRPNLLDTINGEERPSPKRLSEGDIEKTHFVFKIIPEREVFLILENNGNGINLNNFMNYLNHFAKEFQIRNNGKKNFTIKFGTIFRNDFLTELERCSRVKKAEIYFNKRLLGGDALNFSNRTRPLKRDLMLTAFAEKGNNIIETIVDVFNKYSRQNDEVISKVRVFGLDEAENDITLDTSFLELNETVQSELNDDTGEVVTTNIITQMRALAMQTI